MATRREAHRARRRDTHSRMRLGGVMRQEGESSREGPDESPKAAKAVKAWKARKA